MINYWKKLPTWGQWLAGVGGGVAVLYSAAVWSAEAVDKAVVTETELGVVLKSLQVQKDQERLMELNRDIIAERYANDAEKQLILTEINAIQARLKCANEGICEIDGTP